MKNVNLKQIITPVSDLRNRPENKSELETQCLFGETVCILEINDDWGYCKCELDNYEGWLKLSDLGEITIPNYKINKLITHVYKDPDLKSTVLNRLYFNSKVSITNKYENWSELLIGKNKGYICNNNICKINKFDNNFIRTCMLFLNAPYLWGGKTYLGIDCSGLIQIALQTAGINFPRNTSDQQVFSSTNFKDLNNVENLCLIFWKGHVAVALEKNKILHSNAYHMSVIIETLDEAKKRINASYGDIISIKKIIF